MISAYSAYRHKNMQNMHTPGMGFCGSRGTYGI